MTDDPMAELERVAEMLADWCPRCPRAGRCPAEDPTYPRPCHCCSLVTGHYLAGEGTCYPCRADIAFWCDCSRHWFAEAAPADDEELRW